MPLLLIAAYHTRHDISIAQMHALRAYRVVQVNPPGRAMNARDLWLCVCAAANTVPDVLITSFNGKALGELVRLAERYRMYDGRRCEIVKPLIIPGTVDGWDGEWRSYKPMPNASFRLTADVWHPVLPVDEIEVKDEA